MNKKLKTNGRIEQIENPDKKAAICSEILRDLPQWFGIESATQAYIEGVRSLPFWGSFEKEAGADGRPLGFVTVKWHSPETAEIYVTGVKKSHHRTGLGTDLFQQVERDVGLSGARFLTVKTLSEAREDENYRRTRNFYMKNGFVKIEEFPTLWGEENPCLFLLKALSPAGGQQ